MCFDLGGVVVRCVDSWAHACELAGVPQLFDDTDPAVRQRIVNAAASFERAQIDLFGFADRIAAESDYKPAQVVAVIDRWLVEPYPGVGELIDELRAAGVRTACLSNTNHRHWEQMLDPAGAFGLVARLDHLFASHLIAARKPDDAAYDHVERSLGVDPRGVLFFDDREENVTAAAFNLWKAELIDPRKDTAAQLRKHLARHGVLAETRNPKREDAKPEIRNPKSESSSKSQ